MRKRMVYRADDIGYTEAFDLGAFKAIENGIVTSADVMLDSPHTKEALLWLKERPWISVGWHRHLWESPVLDPEEVPSLVDEEGRFRWRHNFNEYRKLATYEDAYKEFKAELELCKKYLGRYPDTYGGMMRNNEDMIPLEKACEDVVRELKIDTHYERFTHKDMTQSGDLDERFKNVKYSEWPRKTQGIEKHERWHLSHFDEYHPEEHIYSVIWSSDDEIWRVGGHPGYLDDHILKESTCNVHRVRDLQVCCSEELKRYIIDNKIELVNQVDAIHGSNIFQDHLKQIGSPLWIGNILKEER